MNEHTVDDLSDDELLALLGRALRTVDPVPSVVTEYANASFGLRSLDAELAELVFDSSVDDLVGVRSGGDTREITFRSPGLEIEVAVVAEGQRRIVGQLVPAQVASVSLIHREGRQVVETDALGRFSFDAIPTGPISLRCTFGSGQTVQTDWMMI